jgi:hypothetical protein
MLRLILAVAAMLSVTAMMPNQAGAAVCAAGVYRAGCAGPNGAVAVRKPPPPVYARPTTVTCARGVYRAGCVRR